MSQYDDHDYSSHLKQADSEFTQLVEQALSRRQFLRRAGLAGLGAFLMATPLTQAIAEAVSNTATTATSEAAKAAPSTLLGFKSIPASTADTVVVPEGYQYQVLISWGDPLFSDAPEFDPSGKTPANAQERQFGDNTDGMTFFPIDDQRGVLAVNNEYINPELMFAHQGKEMTAEDVKTAQAAHGVSIFEVVKQDGRWVLDKTGKLNRRITATTPMELTGPAAGHELLKTSMDATGTKVLGTMNNCANGFTPWGTYLTCEENFNNYFGTADEKFELNDQMKRYGVDAKEMRYQWSKFDERFDIAKNPNEMNRFGWVVEIDPMDPTSIPKKHTALGHIKHENAEVVINPDGRLVVYMGDDERGEYLYKFVSKGQYKAEDKQANSKLLDEGTLYVAQFNSANNELKGQGAWIELTHGKNGLTKENGFADQGEVLIKTRQAATQVGGTTMDRPEWVAAHPDGKTVFCTLTNNKNRGKKDNQPVDGVNPRAENPYGHIVRWMPTNADHSANTFDWDLFVLAGNPNVHKEGLMAGSANINPDNMFNSPDGIGFDKDGRLWIQTDGNYSNKKEFEGMGNNQMLCADPKTGEIRRFLTGPVACEITGLTFTHDYTSMFVGIQHPGEDLEPSHFPAGGDSKPRSSIIVITRTDGGIIGA
ncbi:MAG: PhoX family phosphatase [Thiofilum sp.]|uniref:PhoX family protein n=1 Tax=Thiofilum sp. TaxID=2212733 RepID=UPI0025CFBC54|nr:PhoX family phosphatase [Thiofilum sp.]MBK8452725.1 PhoX family phosphatase [Thiofilum sp.]